jgi:hypothetical protein
MPSDALRRMGGAQRRTTVGCKEYWPITTLLLSCDLVKEWSRSQHGNAWDGHHVESGKIQVRAFLIVVLKGGNRIRNDLRLWIGRIDSRLTFLSDQKGVS